MDITSQKIAGTAAMHVKGPDGALLYDNGQPVRIIFHSPGSAAAAEVEARQTARATANMRENDGKLVPYSPEERRRHGAEDLATMTAGFEHLEYPPAGKAQGLALYQAVYLDRELGFIAEQGAKFVGEWGKFKQGSAIA